MGRASVFFVSTLTTLLLTACTWVPRDPPESLLLDGKDLLAQKKYRPAGEFFSAIKQRHPESAEDEEATYLYAETKRIQRYGGSAFKGYKDFALRYPNSGYSVAAADGQYKLGLAYFKKDLWGIWIFKPDPEVGARVMEHMQVHYRNHALADDALMRAGDWFMSDKQWRDAQIYYQRLLQEYPRSSFILRARFQYARALWEMSEGKDYDERILLDARRGFRDFVAAVRADTKEEELASQIETSDKLVREIQERLAHKQYRVGRFYERTERPGSALFYYRYCLTEYPDTKYAKDCAVRAKTLTEQGVQERPVVPEPSESAKPKSA